MPRATRLRALSAVAVIVALPSCNATDPGVAAGTDAGPTTAAAAYVVLVSFDGFRFDYLDRGLTPVLDSLERAGLRADALIPVMPTKTFPNHYAIATGMYSAEHRLVANTFHDSALGTYSPADRTTVENGEWYGGEPIWVAARRQGLRTASMFWVGTEAAVDGIQPDTWHRFDATVEPEARVDSVLAWLQQPPDQRPRLLTLYFEFTDDAGSRSGPDSPESDSAIARADRMIGRLVHGMQKLPHADSITLLVTSDHGMADVRGAVFLDEYDISLDGVRAMFQGPLVTFYTGGDSARMSVLRGALQHLPRTRTYDRRELPAEWHWSDPRLGDLITVADDGWLIDARRRALPAGAHGWPPSMSEMRGIFVASGPGIASGARVSAFENVHIHAYIAALLGIEPGAGSAGPGTLEKYLPAGYQDNPDMEAGVSR